MHDALDAVRQVVAGQPVGVAKKLLQEQWIAARAFSVSPTGRPDAEAHTNPVYVYVDGQKPFDQRDRDWLLAKLDGRIALLEKREFAEKPQVIQFFHAARQKLLER